MHQTAQEAATYLFPKERGRLLLNALLQNAQGPEVTEDGTGKGDFAVVRLESIERFARQHQGWGKDTTLRYISVLEALQLVRRQRTASYTELHIPFGPWIATEEMLAALDALLVEEAARAKLQQLARGVRERFLLLYGTPSTHFSLIDEMIATLSDVEALLSKRLCAKKRQLVQLRVVNLKTRLEGDAQKGDLRHRGGFAAGGDRRNGASSTHGASSASEGDQSIGEASQNPAASAEPRDLRNGATSTYRASFAEEGDCDISQGSQKAHASTQEGDQRNGSSRSTFAPLAEKGDQSIGEASQNPSAHAQKGDLPTSQESQTASARARKQAVSGESGKVRTEEGDFEPPPAAIVNDNGNIYNTTNNNTTNVIVNDVTSSDRHTTKEAGVVGQRLAHFLEKSPTSIGGYVNKAKQCTRTVIRAAIVDLLVHEAFPTIDPTDERGRPKHRGRWFHDACNRFSIIGSLPAYVMRWVQTDLSWAEIEAQLQTLAIAYQSYMVASGDAADLVRGYLRAEIDQQGLDQALQDLKMPAVQTTTAGSPRPIRMIEWKGRMVPEEQAYREGYYGGFERFRPSDHPDDDLEAVVKRLQAEGKLPILAPRERANNG